MEYADRDLSQPGMYIQAARMIFRYAPELVLAKEMPEPFQEHLLEVYPDSPINDTPGRIQLDEDLIEGMQPPAGYVEACELLLELMKIGPQSSLSGIGRKIGEAQISMEYYPGPDVPAAFFNAKWALHKLIREAPDSYLAKFIVSALKHYADDPGVLECTALLFEEFLGFVNDFHRDIRTARVIYDRHPGLFTSGRDTYDDYPIPAGLRDPIGTEENA